MYNYRISVENEIPNCSKFLIDTVGINNNMIMGTYI